MTITVGVDTWKTKDRALAAWLSLYFEIVLVERNRGVIHWHFEDTEDLRQAIDEFHNGDAFADVNEYISAYHRVLHEFL